MKWIFPAALGLCLLTGIYWAMGSFSDEDYPYRKPGLWEVTNQSSSGTPEFQKIDKLVAGTKVCIDRETDKLLLQGGQAISKQMCPKADAKVHGKTIIVETECGMPGMRATGRNVWTIQETSYHA